MKDILEILAQGDLESKIKSKMQSENSKMMKLVERV